MNTKLITKIAKIGRTVDIKKGGRNPHFNSAYARLNEDILESLNPALEEAGISIMFMKRFVDGVELIDLIIVDDKEGGDPIILTSPIRSTEIQKRGSEETYLRRYMIVDAFNLQTEADDDGNMAQGLNTTHATAQSNAISTNATDKQINLINMMINDGRIPSDARWLGDLKEKIRARTLTKKQASNILDTYMK